MKQKIYSFLEWLIKFFAPVKHEKLLNKSSEIKEDTRISYRENAIDKNKDYIDAQYARDIANKKFSEIKSKKELEAENNLNKFIQHLTNKINQSAQNGHFHYSEFANIYYNRKAIENFFTSKGFSVTFSSYVATDQTSEIKISWR